MPSHFGHRPRQRWRGVYRQRKSHRPGCHPVSGAVRSAQWWRPHRISQWSPGRHSDAPTVGPTQTTQQRRMHSNHPGNPKFRAVLPIADASHCRSQSGVRVRPSRSRRIRYRFPGSLDKRWKPDDRSDRQKRTRRVRPYGRGGLGPVGGWCAKGTACLFRTGRRYRRSFRATRRRRQIQAPTGALPTAARACASPPRNRGMRSSGQGSGDTVTVRPREVASTWWCDG